MVLGFGQSKGASPAKRPEDVASLIAKKNYAKAIELLKRQLAASRHDSRLRLQLADLLVLAGKGREAVTILLALADEFAREGFAAKAISVLKKVQKIDPLQRDVDARLASLIQEKQKQATVAPPPASMPEFGIEEIGFEPPLSSPPSEPPSGPPSAPAFVPELEAEPAAEIGLAAPPPPPAPLPPPVEDRDFEEAEGALPIESDAAAEGGLRLDAIASAEPELTLEPEAAAEPALELEPEPEVEAATEPELTLEPEVEAEPMTETAFADELMSLVEGAFREDAAAPAPAAPGGSQIVVSPLFKDFSVDEMVAVIQGLNLITFEPGDIILTEGDAGDSLYMLTSGTVKAVKRNAAGRQVAIGEMAEGAFFGEISILTGRPRTATVVATSRCELLELDRPTLDSIVASHPHVRQVLEQFSKERLANLSRR